MAKPLVPNQTVNKWPRWNLNPGSLKYSVELTVQIFKIYNWKSPVWGLFCFGYWDPTSVTTASNTIEIYGATHTANNHLTLTECS